ncbi:MAG: sodium-translocating pyrophosphatase [Clostridia bacterium]|nr:sodium-translocating pyrophosphatase [Clostridia bacterium]
MIIYVSMFAVTLALCYAAINYTKTVRLSEGSAAMIEIASAIRTGANAFMTLEYKMLIKFSIILSLLIGIFISYSAGIACAIGVIMSSCPSWIGMKIATYSNVRTTNTARSGNISETVRVALRGGSVMGLSVSAFTLLGFIIVYALFNGQLGYLGLEKSWIGFEFQAFNMTLSSYSLGCSVVAMFARIGGGIYTKAADMGADLVGKTEFDIEEDSPYNPATIADNVGDNVGDVAGLGSDLLESTAGAIVSAMLLGVYTFSTKMGANASIVELKKLCLYPLGVASFGLIACVIGLAFVLSGPMSDEPHKDLNNATLISAVLTAISAAILSYFMFQDMICTAFRFGAISPFISALMGVISGIIIGKISEYYTSYDYKPTLGIAKISKEGSALTIIEGLAVGLMSCLPSLIVIGIALLVSFFCSDLYGIAIAGAGMLSFVATTVSVDTYGPISDNAGGIAEMAGLDPKVRAITDKLDAVGNTTAAIGKGFAIGSATFAALGLMVNYLNAYQISGTELVLNAISPLVLVGILVGLMLPAFFSGMLMRSVRKAADGMVIEVRRQFTENPGILKGTVKPDSKRCIEISSSTSLNEMKASAILAVVVPVASGFIFGTELVAGLLLGGIGSAILLAILCGNAGGAWDNAKKAIEIGMITGEGKGTIAHIASVVGDTVGDPLKDTVGPCLDIFIKIMSTVSLVTVCMFSKYNLLDLLQNLF